MRESEAARLGYDDILLSVAEARYDRRRCLCRRRACAVPPAHARRSGGWGWCSFLDMRCVQPCPASDTARRGCMRSTLRTELARQELYKTLIQSGVHFLASVGKVLDVMAADRNTLWHRLSAARTLSSSATTKRRARNSLTAETPITSLNPSRQPKARHVVTCCGYPRSSPRQRSHGWEDCAGCWWTGRCDRNACPSHARRACCHALDLGRGRRMGWWSSAVNRQQDLDCRDITPTKLVRRPQSGSPSLHPSIMHALHCHYYVHRTAPHRGVIGAATTTATVVRSVVHRTT